MNSRSTSQRRGQLARVRTALGLAVLGIFLLRQGLARHTWLDLTAALVALGCAVACATVRPTGARASSTAPCGPRLLVSCVLLISGLAFAGALTSRP